MKSLSRLILQTGYSSQADVAFIRLYDTRPSAFVNGNGKEVPSLEKLAGLHSYRISGFVSKRLSTALAFFSKTGFFVGAGKWIDHSFCNAAIIAGKKSSAVLHYLTPILSRCFSYCDIFSS